MIYAALSKLTDLQQFIQKVETPTSIDEVIKNA